MSPSSEQQRLLHARLLESSAALVWLSAEQVTALSSSHPSSAAGAATVSFPAHSAECRRVVVQTLAGRHATAEQQARLRFKQVMHRMVWEAEGAEAGAAAAAAAVASATGSPGSIAAAEGVHENAAAAHIRSAPGMVASPASAAATLRTPAFAPFLRALPDGRVALFLADCGGDLLERCIDAASLGTDLATSAAPLHHAVAPPPVPAHTALRPAAAAGTSARAASRPLAAVARMTLASLQLTLRVGTALARKLAACSLLASRAE